MIYWIKNILKSNQLHLKFLMWKTNQYGIFEIVTHISNDVFVDRGVLIHRKNSKRRLIQL